MTLKPDMIERMDDFDSRPPQETSIETPAWLQVLKDKRAAEKAGQPPNSKPPA